MSKIDEMIKELCPDGVEYRTLLDLLSQPITDGPHETPKLQDDGIPFVSVEAIHDGIVDVSKCRGYISLEYSETCRKKYKPETDDVYMVKSASVGRVAIVGEDTTFDIWSPIAAMRPDKTIIIPRFLFYSLQTNVIQKEVVFQSSTGSQPNLSMRKLERFEIPLPPLSIQQKIVSVLDSFTTLIDKMKQEVEMRKKQMEYYREKLLTFEDGECEWKTLGEVAKIGTGSGNTNEGLEEGLYPFYTRGQEVLRKNTFEYDEEAIITAGDGVGVGKVMHYVKGKYALHQRAYRFKPNEGLSTKYLYYYMQVTFYKYVCGNAVASSVNSLRKPKLQVYPIPVPSLDKQAEIVSTLDKFESYITKLEKMIVLRQKQYEYYREQLLTFE